MNYVITEATLEHVQMIAPRLRDGDRREITCVGFKPMTMLRRCFRASLMRRAVLVDGEIAGIWGMGGGMPSPVGTPWLMTAPPIERIKKAFIREARGQVAEMLAIKPRLRGYVAADYVGAVRLLDALGFEISNPFPYGPNGARFRMYEMRR